VVRSVIFKSNFEGQSRDVIQQLINTTGCLIHSSCEALTFDVCVFTDM